MIINVSIIPMFSGAKSTYVLDSATSDFRAICKMHKSISKRHPEAHVNFTWGKDSFIAGMPYGQELDEQRLRNEEISWAEYSNKWYGLN